MRLGDPQSGLHAVILCVCARTYNRHLDLRFRQFKQAWLALLILEVLPSLDGGPAGGNWAEVSIRPYCPTR